MPCHADALCMGVLIAYATRHRSLWETVTAHRKYIYSALALASSVGLWMVLGDFEGTSMQHFDLQYSLLAAIYSLLLMTTLLSRWFSGLFSSLPLRFMGTIAYGFFLFFFSRFFCFSRLLL